MAKWFIEHNTKPDLHMTITCYFRHKVTLSFLDPSPRSLPLSSAQDEIGWNKYLKGKLSSEIRHKQVDYLDTASSNKAVTA